MCHPHRSPAAPATIDVFNQTGVAGEITTQRVTGSSAAPPVSLGAVGTGAPTATADSSGTTVFAGYRRRALVATNPSVRPDTVVVTRWRHHR